jgi:hypothetical protein
MVVGIGAEDWGGNTAFGGSGGKTMGQDIAANGLTNIRIDSGAGSDLSKFYTSQGLHSTLLINQTLPSSGVSGLNASSYASNAVSVWASDCGASTTNCPNIEVLNEPYGNWSCNPNCSSADSTANAQAYGDLVEATYNAFHAQYGSNSPKILAYTFANGCSNGSAVGCSDPWASELLAHDPTIANYYDGVLLHPYGGTGDSTLSAQGDRNAITSAHQYTGKPVYVTEVGWPTDCSGSCPSSTNETGDSLQWSEQEQADNIYNFITWARGTGYVNAVYIYAYLDDAAPGWYGLSRGDNNPNGARYTHKPAWTVLGCAANNQPESCSAP